MKQMLKSLFTVILVTLVAACGVATPSPDRAQKAVPIAIGSATSSPTPVTPSATPQVSMLPTISPNIAHSVSSQNLAVRGAPGFSPDGERLILPTGLGIMVVDTSSYQNWHLQIAFAEDNYDRVTISPDGKLIMRGNQLIALDDDHAPPELQIPESIHGEGFWAALTESRFSPDSRLLAVSYGNSQMGFWDLSDGKFLFSLSEVLSVDFSLDSRLIAAVTIEDYVWRIQLHDAQTGTLLKEWPGQRGVFLSENRLALEDLGTIRIYDLTTGKVPHFFNGRFPAISPDGELIALVHNDRVEVHQVRDGKLLHRLPGEFTGVDRFDLRFAPDGKSLAGYSYWSYCCGGYAGRLSLWRAADGSIMRDAPFVGTFNFSPDGGSLAVAGNGLQIWDVIDGSVRFDLTAITLR